MWFEATNVSEISVGNMVKVVIEGEPIALYHLDDGFYATSDLCTHARVSLTTGTLDRGVVACPKHGGKFDVRTGNPTAFPCVIPLETFPVQVRGDTIWIDF